MKKSQVTRREMVAKLAKVAGVGLVVAVAARGRAGADECCAP